MANGIPIIQVSGGVDTDIVSDGKINTSAQPYTDAIARGEIAGKVDLNKYARNGDIGTAIEDMWLAGGTKVYLSSAEILKISSSDATDNGVTPNTGARTVTIYGLDDSYAEITDTVTLNGAGVVVTNISFLRVYRMIVNVSGTNLSNKGILTLTNNAGTSTIATIGAGNGQTLMSQYTIPAGKQLLIKTIIFNATGGKDVDVSLFIRPFGGSWNIKICATLNNSTFTRDFLPAFIVAEKSDIVIRCISVQAGGIGTGGWDSILETP